MIYNKIEIAVDGYKEKTVVPYLRGIDTFMLFFLLFVKKCCVVPYLRGIDTCEFHFFACHNNCCHIVVPYLRGIDTTMSSFSNM